MDKRYQVFVSSTYADLRDERRRVIQTLMEMDCIPAGMELFPAADEEQWEFIKRIIDDCDYYLLVIGGRYGSTTSEGVSYTEKEYDYAIARGLKVLAFIHEKPDDIPLGKSDINPELRDRLAAFREKVTKGRLVRFWTTTSDLPGLVALSLSKTIKTYPAIGWVRADLVGSTELLAELNELRKQNQELQKVVSSINVKTDESKIENLADFDESVTVRGTSWSKNSKNNWQCTLTWAEIFAVLSPYLLENPNNDNVKMILTSSFQARANDTGTPSSLNDQDFQTIKIQLLAADLVIVRYTPTNKGTMALFWSLTERGHSLMMQLRTVKKASSNK